ncbi:hypothetical protein C8R43DRAFT_943244 [Mycena crocata]|nr:hypothetical protein C8R43DRAFT_943244 [Mycena crocata]
MPGRHVRFSPTNTVVPAAGPSVSPPTSSRSPATRAAHVHAGTHEPIPRLTQSYSATGKLRAHNLLAFSSTPLLHYDISLSPSSMSTPFMGLSSADFDEPAVHPPQPVLSLATPHLPWPIPVAATNGRYVTVSDLLHALYRSLRTRVTPMEFETLGSSKLMRKVSAAYTRRYERLRGHRGYTEEKMHGVRRIDFLMGFTMIQGISPTTAPDVWQVHTR